MKNILHTVLNMVVAICLVAALSITSVQRARADDLDGNSLFIIELINWIRLDPLSYAEELGYNRELLIEDLPWLMDFTENKLPLLNITGFLNKKASFLNNSMNFDEYAYYETKLEALQADPDTADEWADKTAADVEVSFEAAGLTALDHWEEYGQYEDGMYVTEVTAPEPLYFEDYARTGEITGVISFHNFMDPKTAVRIIINNRFKRELDAGFEGQRCILNKEFNLAGTSFKAGNIALESFSGHAYFLTTTFGSSLLKSQRQILNLINQVRTNPYKAQAWLLLNLDAFLGQQYSPLFLNDVLQEFVTTDYMNTQYYAIHAKNFGYNGYGVNQSSTIETFPRTGENAMISWIFSSLVLNEIKGFSNTSVVFGPDYKDVGIDLLFVNGLVTSYARLALIAGTGSSENKNPEVSKIYGLVYADANLDGAYTPGEGVANRSISIHDGYTFVKLVTVLTDNTGHFSVPHLFNNKAYIILTGSGDNFAGKEIFLGRDQFFSLKVNR